MTALSRGLSDSIRSIAVSTSSFAETAPVRTSSARPSASYEGYSVKLMTGRKHVAMLMLDQETLGGIDPLLELGHLVTDALELGHVRRVVFQQRFVVFRKPALAALEHDRGPDATGDAAG